MPVTLGANIDSLRVQRSLSANTSRLGTTLQHLSSGQRINRASDDAAGLAISENLKADTMVYAQGIRNVNDAISATRIAEGAFSAVSSILQRQIELAEQAANGVYSLSQRKALDREANQLVAEVNRIIQTTSFNGLNLVDGTFTNVGIQAGYGAQGALVTSIAGPVQIVAADGTFQTTGSSSNSSGFRTSSVDFNGDGYSDLVSANTSTFYVSLANSNGTFKAATGYIVAGPVFNGQATGDVNNDGLVDFVSASISTSALVTFLGNGDGTFKGVITSSSGSGGTETTMLYDINSDGNLDAIGIGTNVSRFIRVALGNGDGTFATANVFAAAGASFYDVGFGDLNGDNLIDIYDGANVYRGNGNGTFQAGTAVGSASNGAGIGDYNGDGNLDLINTTELLLGNGNGTFKSAIAYGGAASSVLSKSVDFNEDGNLDAIAFNVASEVQIFLGNGNGTFQAVKTVLSTTGGSIEIGDFNGDSALDIVTATAGSAYNIFLSNSTTRARMNNLDLKTRFTARASLDYLRTAISDLNTQLGKIGATQSRFDAEISVLSTTTSSLTDARSRIMDADIAGDSAELTRLSILQQASASILAQANQAPQLALMLLRG